MYQGLPQLPIVYLRALVLPLSALNSVSQEEARLLSVVPQPNSSQTFKFLGPFYILKNYWEVQGTFVYVNYTISTFTVLEIKTEKFLIKTS